MAKNEKGKQQNRTSIWKQLLVLFFLGGIALAAQLVVLIRLSIPIVQKHQTGIVVLCALVLALALFAAVLFLIKGKQAIYRSILSGLFLWLFFLLVLGIAEWTDFITVMQSEALYRDFLIKTGAYMPYIFIALQVVQVLFLPIPGVFSYLAGIQLFGAVLAAVYSLIGMVLGSLIAFWIGRRWGNKAVSWIVGEETLATWQSRIKGKDNLLLTAMFVLPFFPDDILCFVAGLSTMSTRYFVVMMICARAVAVFLTVYSISLIPFNTWWGVAVWGGIFVVIVVVFILLYKNLDKLGEYLQKKRKKK
ncbi:MAG: TVP38/TMEM64 family protein [Clostridia bacterium]|nr:TVP38/TMEM64 family protein [Clostridia bacterium]